MSFGVQKNLTLNKDELKDLESYCALNKLNIDDVIKKSYLQGYHIEKYGLLGELGVAQEKITTNAMGEQNPIDDNNTEEGRLNNRRVEIWLRK